jgi:hypothetical protein
MSSVLPDQLRDVIPVVPGVATVAVARGMPPSDRPWCPGTPIACGIGMTVANTL